MMFKESNSAVKIGRIEYLSRSGQAKYSTEYDDETLMIAEIKECLNVGVPITIILYRGKDGETISKKFTEDLDCLPAGFKEIDYPY